MVIPAVFRPVRREWLGTPGRAFMKSRVMQRDVVKNLLGFMPFGFLLAWVLAPSRRVGAGGRFVIAILVAGGVSLAIEWAQAYLPSRHSSILDLALNTAGAALGAAPWLAVEGVRRLAASRSSPSSR